MVSRMKYLVVVYLFFVHIINAQETYNYDLIIYIEGLNYNINDNVINESIWETRGIKNALITEFGNKIIVIDNNFDVFRQNGNYLDIIEVFYKNEIDSIIGSGNYQRVVLIGNNELSIILPKIYSLLSNKEKICNIILMFRPEEQNILGLTSEERIEEYYLYRRELGIYNSISVLFIEYIRLLELALWSAHDPRWTYFYEDREINNETAFKILNSIINWIKTK